MADNARCFCAPKFATRPGLGDPKPASELDAGNASLALGEVVHGAKPSPQRHFGRRENRSGDQVRVSRPRPADDGG
jgi:hypothetical protein